MRVLTSLFIALGVLACASSARAQLSLVVQMDPAPSPYISDWRSNPNTVRFIITNSTGTPVEVRFSAFIEGDVRGVVARSKTDAAIPPVIIPTGTTMMNAIDAGLLDEQAVEYVGNSRAQTQRTGRLPEDNFRICVRLIEYGLPHAPLSPEACARFEIQLIQPPSLIAPANANSVLAPPAFQWTPVSLGRGTFARYELSLVELDPGQTNITNAMQSNLPLLVRETSLPVYQTLAADPKLEKGKRYAWRVRAFDVQDRYSFANGGLSEIWSFTYAPVVPTGFDSTRRSTATGRKPAFSPAEPYASVNPVKVHVLTSARIDGQLLYTFNRTDLLTEFHVGSALPSGGHLPSMQLGSGGDLKPLANVVLRLVRRYKSVPELYYMDGTVWDQTNQKSYTVTPKTIGETKSDANGNFAFSFIESEPTTIVSGVTLRSGGGEFVDVKQNATLYKYYVVEVVDPHYCSSLTEIAVEPGGTASTTLSSLVRSYNLRITVKDAEKGEALGARVNVYVARPSATLHPPTTPDDEGELVASSGPAKYINLQTGAQPDDPEHKFSSDQFGWVIGASHTRDTPQKGVVVFKRLVRNVGGWDGYYVSAITPEKTPSGNTNALYYHPNARAWWASFPKANTDPGWIDTGTDYSGLVVYNKAYVIPTFEHTLQLKPKLSRMIGQVKRKDSDSSMEQVVVRLTTNPDTPPDLAPGQYDGWFYDVTGKDGRFEINNIAPSGANWSYNVSFLKYGCKDLVMEGQAIPKGRQIDVGTKYLMPRITITRMVVDEENKPLAGVEGVLGDGATVKTDAKGVFVSPAIPGWQPLHLEKRVQFADKDTNVVIQDNAFEVLGALLVDKLVMFEAKRRLAIRVIDAAGEPVDDAEVALTDFAPPVPAQSAGKSPGGTAVKIGLAVASPYRKRSGPDGWVHFAFLSPSDVVNVGISVPNSDFIPTKRTIAGVKEDGSWTQRMVVMQAGGRVTGVVYAGAKREKTKSSLNNKGGAPQITSPNGRGSAQTQAASQIDRGLQPQTSAQLGPLTGGVPVRNARVFIEGREDLPVYTDEQGRYELRAVPPGQRTVKAARASDSVGMQLIGDQKSIAVVAQQTTPADLYLTTYNGMDITRLLGFPVEIDKLTELPGGRIRIDGALVNIPDNTIFKVRNPDDRHAFANVELVAVSGTGSGGSIPAARPQTGSLRLLDTKIALTAYGTYNTDLVNSGGVEVVAEAMNYAKGRFRALCRLPMSGWALNSNELTLADPDGNPVNLHLRRSSSAPNPSPLLAALTSEGGTFDDGGVPLRVCGADGGDAPLDLYAYHVRALSDSSFLSSEGMRLRPTLTVTLAGCGSTYTGSCTIALRIGDVRIRPTGMDPLDASSIPDQTIPLQKWQLVARNFSIQSSYLTFHGEIRAPVVSNKIDPASTVIVPYTDMQLRPAGLTGGSFPQSSINILGITKIELTDNLTFASDMDSWYLAAHDPEIRVDQGGGKRLEGFDPAEKIVLTSLLLRSNATHKFSPSEKSLVAWNVSTFKLASLQIDWDVDRAVMSMQGSLTLTNVPDLAPQYTRLYFTEGGKFGMDGVYLNDGYIAGGVRLFIANGQLGPDGFTAEGDWGSYRNRIALQGKFALNMRFRHRNIGSGYSTIAEVINPSHTPPQNQSLFGNSSQPDVKSVYGRTQLEPGLIWSTNLSGWYNTSELAGKDSVYFAVEGSGGNGTVVTATGTLKMKGTRGGISSLSIERPGQWPKGPVPRASGDMMSGAWDESAPGPTPDPADDGPFSGMTITTDFDRMALIASVQIDYEITPGTRFKGFIETVVSFGSEKFWSFFAAGSGTVDNPPCEGKAVFIAGLNYAVPEERRQMLIDYSISKRPLPDEFATMTGFFTQVAVTMPIPGTPNFSIDVVAFSLSVECSMGGEARLGLNFANGTTFYIGIYATAKVEIYAGATLFVPPIPVAVSVSGHALLAAGAGGYYTYNSSAGSSFDITGFILGQLDVEGCVWVLGAEACTGTFTVFKVGGDVNGRLGNNEYLDIKPTFEFLSF